MKKRMLSLLCVLALCLGLLPVTALAEGGAPTALYVGNQVLKNSISYWTTDSETGDLTEYTEGGDAWNVKYDPYTVTLTLKNATVVGKAYGDNNDGIGIYATSSSGSLSLNIELDGNSKVFGMYGINVVGNGNASLNISGSGSLTVSATATNGIGIFVQAQSGDANLTIDGANVNAVVTENNGRGVELSTGQAGNPNLTIEVKGGSLQASGQPNGIIFFTNKNNTQANANLKVSGNAMVKTSGITTEADGSGSHGAVLTTEAGSGETGGIVWNGSEGTVYGDVTLDESLTIDQGETLTVPSGSSLNCDGKLTNNGTILASGGTVSGNLSDGKEVTTPSISDQPTNQTVTEGSAAEFSVTASDAQTYQWQQSTDSGSNWTNIESATSAKYTTEATTTSMSGYQYRCVVKSASGVSVISNAATLTVKSVPVTGVTLNTDKLELFTGESETLTATFQPANATNQNVTWSSNNNAVATVEGGSVTAVKEGTATITVKTVDGNYTATCTVTVTDKTYTITADPAKLDFDAAYLGYKTQPAPQTVTITNTGNQQVTVTLPTATDFVITEGNGFARGSATIEPGNTATFTVQPKADLAVGSYKESINISGSNGNHKVSTSVDVTFAVVDINDTKVDNKLTVTSGISDNITYYTCPSCGYHNWTATEAGYRCDNCGYLESTRQLSGYGNVKGTYTPGSGATSTAASAVPQTGDESNPVLWTVLLLVSGLALGGLAIAKRKKQQ